MTDNKVSDAAHAQNLSATEADGVRCELDGTWVHSIPAYLAREYPDETVKSYQAKFDDAPLFSPSVLARRAAQSKPDASLIASHTATVHALQPKPAPSAKKSFAEVFELGNAKAAQNKRGDPIMIEVLGALDADLAAFIPKVDANYLFPIDNLKAVMMACTLVKPCLLWGKHGTGKTTLIQQFAARTRRAAIRIQHTVSTEESHILGQYVLRDGATHFQPGPLSYAMRFGLIYIADEYDFALPSVLSLYQPVLEGQSLVIKDAPPEWRVVEPHENFRFFATGNTNGGGDETGLYQGTQMQNAANYSRFGITVEVDYMPEDQEVGVVAAQGKIFEGDARKLVSVAKHIREAYQRGDIGVTVSPRELIGAAQLGRALGGEWRQGLALAYTNRLNTVDRTAVLEIVQRILNT